MEEERLLDNLNAPSAIDSSVVSVMFLRLIFIPVILFE